MSNRASGDVKIDLNQAEEASDYSHKFSSDESSSKESESQEDEQAEEEKKEAAVDQPQQEHELIDIQDIQIDTKSDRQEDAGS